MEAAELLSEGKTKKIFAVNDAPVDVIAESKDDITAGDGKKHDVIPMKAQWATTTTCNVFRLLQQCRAPVAFKEQIDATSFLAPRCRMIPLEVVVRREAHGSFLQRNPNSRKGTTFPRLMVEFFLKTSGRHWQGREQLYDLACDDPLVIIEPRTAKTVFFFDPHKPLQDPFLELPLNEVFDFKNVEQVFMHLSGAARYAFLVLEKSWQILDRRLVDFKIEFGVPFGTSLDENGSLPVGQILIADVIDNDSWRVLQDGAYIDKQIYRDGKDISVVAENYRLVAELTGNFSLPKQALVLWRGSEKDDFSPFHSAIIKITRDNFPLAEGEKHPVVFRDITVSGHKQPISAMNQLYGHLLSYPDSVIIAYVGRSNALGPMLSANCMAPVISVPASWKDFPDDVWSSLRTPSDVPTATILDPGNAVLAALQILAIRNPAVYACLKMRQEERLINVLEVCLS